MKDWQTLNTPQKIDAIKEVWKPGMTASNIASCFRNASRNAVCGLFNRWSAELGHAKLGSTTHQIRAQKVAKVRKERSARVVAIKPAPFAVIPADQYDATALRIPLMALQPGQCRWCVNTPSAGELHLFCALPADEGPYCPQHRARAKGHGTDSERPAHRFRRRAA